jgi:Alpha/beta hydrolase
VPDSSTGGFGINQQDVNEAASLMSNLSSSGTEVSKALGVLDPLVFGVIGSSVGAANTSLENAVLQSLQGVLNLFSGTSGDIQAAASNYADADSAIADTLGSITDSDTTDIGTGDGDIPSDGYDIPAAADVPDDGDLPADEILAEEISIPAGDMALGAFGDADISAEGMLGSLAGDESISAGLDSSVLSRLAGPLGELGEEAESEFMSLFRSLGGESSAASKLWNGLTEDEQEEAMASGGGTIGELDGIPSEVRNLVNTDELDDLMEATQAQIEDLRSAAVQADEEHDDDEEKALLCLQQAAVLGVQLAGLRALQGQLQANPNAYLLAVSTDPGGTGRYILAINNPDTADNVATLVPSVRIGLSEGKNGISGLAAAAANLVAAASEADRGQSTSVVIWANYSAPHIADAEAPPAEPQAAPALAQFQHGLHSTNGKGSSLHTTVIGNAAGSVLVGEAAKLPGSLSADDVVALGSPSLDATISAALSSNTGSSAAGGGSHVWLYVNESGDKGSAVSLDYFSSASRIMPDMAHVIVGDYANIYHLAKQ